MDIAEARRLVQQIVDSLGDPRRQFQDLKLAREYAEVCQAVNLRLEQCVALIRGGQVAAGLHLAEAAPAALDLIAVLGFREERQWRTRCEGKDFPVPKPFNDDHVRALNEEFSRDINADHPLYRDYRQAILHGRDDRALAVLRLIERLKPDSTDAAAEAARLEKKFARSRLEKLEQAVERKDEGATLKILAGLERLEFSPGQDLDLWRRAQTVRLRARLRQLSDLRDKDRWEDARKVADRVDTLRSEFQLDLDEKELGALKETREWIRKRAAETEEDRRYRKVFGELQHIINVCEEKYLAVRRRPVAELRADFEALAKKWQELQRFERAVPEEFEEKFDKYFRLVRYQVRQRERMNKLALVTITLIVMAVTIAAVTIVRANRRAGQLAAELEQYGRQRQPVAADRFRQQIVTNDVSLLAIPSLNAALAKANAFIEREDKIRRLAEEKALWLLQQGEDGFVEFSPEQYLKHFAEAEALQQAVAADFAPDVEDRLIDCRNQWEAWLFGEREARSARFGEELNKVERVAADSLDLQKGEDSIRGGLKEIEGNLPVLQALAAPQLEELKVTSELTFRFQALNWKFDEFKRKIETWETVRKNLADPDTLPNFVSTLRQFQTSDFAPIENVRRSREVTAANPQISDMIHDLLAWKNDGIRGTIENKAPLVESPSQVSAAERAALSLLAEDESLNTLTRIRILEKRRPTTDPDRTRVIYIKGEIEKDKFGRPAGEAYDPTVSPDEIRFENRQFPEADFVLEEQGPSPEKQLFVDSGLAALADGTDSSYAAGALELIDSLHRDKTANPVFRAYLLQRLFELIDVRPDSFALQWAPALKPLRKKLLDQGVLDIQPGDWIVPRRIQRFTAPMQAYFNEASKVEIRKQAIFLHKLTTRAAEGGFQFVGYVDPDKKMPTAVADAAMNLGELWGWAGETKRPALIFRYDQAALDYTAVRQPLPFSPLFVFPDDRQKLVRIIAGSVGYDPDTAANPKHLPQLFVE